MTSKDRIWLGAIVAPMALAGLLSLALIYPVLSLPPRLTDQQAYAIPAPAGDAYWVEASKITCTHQRRITNAKLTRLHARWIAAHPAPAWRANLGETTIVGMMYRPTPYRQGLWNAHLMDWQGHWGAYPPRTKFFLLTTPELQVEVVGQKLRLHLAPNSHVEIRTDAPRFR